MRMIGKTPGGMAPTKTSRFFFLGALVGGAKRAALMDAQRLLFVDWDGAWRLAQEVELFVDSFDRIYAAFALLSPP